MDKDTVNKLVEAQRESNKQIRLDYEKAYRESQFAALKDACGIDFGSTEEVLKESQKQLSSNRFSWKKLAEKARTKLARNMREAVGENTVGQVLRGAALALANQWYELVPPEHEKIIMTQPSEGAIELYPIVQRGGMPRRVVRGETPPETDLKGIDQQLINFKFMGFARVERDLIEDDRVGVIHQRIQDLGTLPQYVEDAWAMGKLISAAGAVVPGTNDPIPQSQTKPSTESAWPWSTSLGGGGKNRLASYAVMSEAGIQALDLQAMNMVDLQGNKLLVQLTHIFAGTSYKWVLEQILKSGNFMSTVPLKVGGTGSDTTVGTQFAANVLKGAYEPFVSRFLPNTAWGLIEAMKGMVFQRRSANELIQEAPNSSESLRQDAYIWRVRARWNVDWLDPRFAQLGSDGTV